MSEKVDKFILKLEKHSTELMEDFNSLTPEEQIEAKEKSLKVFPQLEFLFKVFMENFS